MQGQSDDEDQNRDHPENRTKFGVELYHPALLPIPREVAKNRLLKPPGYHRGENSNNRIDQRILSERSGFEDSCEYLQMENTDDRGNDHRGYVLESIGTEPADQTGENIVFERIPCLL